jgi:hypothetical protein
VEVERQNESVGIWQRSGSMPLPGEDHIDILKEFWRRSKSDPDKHRSRDGRVNKLHFQNTGRERKSYGRAVMIQIPGPAIDITVLLSM